MFSSYQHHETNYGDMTKTVHERIEDLNRRAYALAPRVAESAIDSGCTDIRPTGPRQSKAWDVIAEAYGWNAISDNAEALKVVGELERDGTSYRIEYGSAGFQVVLVEEPKPEETIVSASPRPRRMTGAAPATATRTGLAWGATASTATPTRHRRPRRGRPGLSTSWARPSPPRRVWAP